MMNYKSTITTVQCGYKRVLKVLILRLNVSAAGKMRPREKFTYYEALVVALVGLQISRLFQEFKILNEISYKIIH